MSGPRHMLRDGRNILPVSNADGRCLMENWVEERAVEKIDPLIYLKGDITSKLQILRHGHKGVLTNDFDAKSADETTYNVMYTPPKVDSTHKVGFKEELMEKMYFSKISQEKNTYIEPEPEPTDFRSIKKVAYDFDFKPKRIPPTRDHNYRSEQPVTFWTEHQDKIHGRTAVKTRDTVFRRNDAFTKPIWEYWDEPKPYELENYPKM